MRRNGEVAKGILKSYDSDQGIVVVQVLFVTLGVHPVDLKILMATSGILPNDSSGAEDGKQLMFSTCKISEVQLNYGLCILSATVYTELYIRAIKLVFSHVPPFPYHYYFRSDVTLLPITSFLLGLGRWAAF